MKSTHTFVAAGVLLFATVFLLDAPVTVTVDLERVFNDIHARNQAEGDLEAKMQTYQVRLQELRAEAEQLAEDRDMLVPGTEKFEDAQKQLMQSALDYRAMSEFVQLKLDATRGEMRRDLFSLIVAAAAEYAQQNDIDFIITNDAIVPIQEGTDMQVVQQLALRRIVYADADYDITDALIEWINR